jgi:hypothetical protein
MHPIVNAGGSVSFLAGELRDGIGKRQKAGEFL